MQKNSKNRYWFFIPLSLLLNCGQAQSYIILAREQGATWKYYDQDAKVITDKKYPRYYAFTEEGYGLVGEDKFTIINRKGEEIQTEIPVMIFDDHHHINAFYSDGLLVTKYRSRFGCLDTAGRIAIPYKYYDLTDFHDGYAIGRVKREFFVVNKKGDEISIADSTVSDVKAFYEHRAAYVNNDGKWGFIGEEGTIAIAPQFAGVGNFHNGLAWARNEAGLIGFIDSDGSWIIKPTFSVVKHFDVESGIAMVKKDNWIYIDSKGEKQPIAVEARYRFSEGMAMSKKGKQFGFVDNKGNWVIEPQFDGADDFDNGLAWVKQQGLWGLIDKAGKWVITPRFEAKGGVAKLK